MDNTMEMEQIIATAEIALLMLINLVSALLAISYLLGQPRTRRYRNALLAVLFCRLPLDALIIAAKALPQGMSLPDPLNYPALLYIPMLIIIMYVAGRYLKTMSRADGRPYLYISLVFWITLVETVLLLGGLLLVALVFFLHPYLVGPY